ncbi:uncharacterized protein LOC130813468 isoform X2 [Amaranthus tricolor]|uniref:uncharacterized protein LOC130813468 isoform X2 n=1 Tax=Amaranthus tricolor TaxID=29722 RepID=UPI00258B7D34|nr:uncharacterized protein LOC130813468 isoform X2 [Amaranthus tricolor]
MDFDPRITSDEHGWHCNFHFGNGYDLIEDVTNEKSCEQALQCLISKADSEILALEDELATLQCQLKWDEPNEQRDPYEVCCDTFKKKINILTNLIMNMRNGNVLNGHEMAYKTERPAERICDIINALIKQNFAVPTEQVEEWANEMDLLFNSCSVDIGTDSRQKETTSELSAESRELITDFESRYKPVETVSEESCSDTTRYALKDPTEARNMGKIDDKVTAKPDIDAYEYTAEGKNELSRYMQAYSSNGNSNSNAMPHGEYEECMAASKNSGGGSSPLSAKMEVDVKVEVDKSDMSIQRVAADSFCKTQDQGSVDVVQCHQEGQRFQRENLGGVRRSNPMMLEPQGKIGKRKFSSSMKNFRLSNSLSEAEQNFSCLSKTVWQRKPLDVTHGNQPRFVGAKEQELQGANCENASIHFREVEVLKGDDMCPRENLTLRSQHEFVVCLKSPLAEEEMDSLFDHIPPNPPNVENNSTILSKVDVVESSSYELESLKEKVSKETDFLKKLKVPVLKNILKAKNVRGTSKMKKDKMIEEVTKLLNAAEKL